MGLPAVYVGAKVGDAVGLVVGYIDGCGVGLPGVYVGARVGEVEGTAVGLNVG